jgi:uncharacterized protein (DUF58 family)
MSSSISSISIKGPGISLEQLIQLRHAAKKIILSKTTNSNSAIGGQHRSTSQGRGMDFEEVRIYQPGDDIRSIDWRVTARTSRVHTKIFREEKERPVLLAIDQGSTMFFGSRVTYKSVMAAELAALLAWSTLQHQDKIGGLIFNHQGDAEIKPKRNKHALLGLLKLLADFNQQLFKNEGKTSDGRTLHKIFEKIRHLGKPGGSLYIISDFSDYDSEAEKLLYLAKRHMTVHAFIVVDSMEAKMPEYSRLTLTDGTQKIALDTGNKMVTATYEKNFREKQKFLESSFNRLGIHHHRFWTHEDPCRALQIVLQGVKHPKRNNIKKELYGI